MTRRDEFDDEGFLDSILNQRRGGSPGSLRRVLAVTAGLAVLGVLGAVAWSSMSDETAVSEDAVPIIRADADPYKVQPEEPGGMAVPNKDSTIFDTLKGQEQQAKVENLFEEEEKPVRKDEVFTSEQAAAAPSTAEVPDAAKDVVSKMPKMPTVTYEAAESEASPPVDVKPVETAAVPPVKELKPVEAAPVAPAPAPVAKKDDTADKAAAIQPAAGGNFYVQLAAVKSEADAKAQWPKLQAKYNQLSDLSLRVQEADLGAKGMYYRIQGGPLNESDARKLCSSLNAQKSGTCVVAKK